MTPIDDEDCDNPIDEYIAFQQVITRESTQFNQFIFIGCAHIIMPFAFCFFFRTVLQAQDPEYYNLITSKLSADQQKGLNDVIVTAEQKKAQYNSKQIQKQGGNIQITQIIMV